MSYYLTYSELIASAAELSRHIKQTVKADCSLCRAGSSGPAALPILGADKVKGTILPGKVLLNSIHGTLPCLSSAATGSDRNLTANSEVQW